MRGPGSSRRSRRRAGPLRRAATGMRFRILEKFSARSGAAIRTVSQRAWRGSHRAMTDRDVFIAALDQEDLAERLAYLREACGDDPAMRERVEALLKVH